MTTPFEECREGYFFGFIAIQLGFVELSSPPKGARRIRRVHISQGIGSNIFFIVTPFLGICSSIFQFVPDIPCLCKSLAKFPIASIIHDKKDGLNF